MVRNVSRAGILLPVLNEFDLHIYGCSSIYLATVAFGVSFCGAFIGGLVLGVQLLPLFMQVLHALLQYADIDNILTQLSHSTCVFISLS